MAIHYIGLSGIKPVLFIVKLGLLFIGLGLLFVEVRTSFIIKIIAIISSILFLVKFAMRNLGVVIIVDCIVFFDYFEE